MSLTRLQPLFSSHMCVTQASFASLLCRLALLWSLQIGVDGPTSVLRGTGLYFFQLARVPASIYEHRSIFLGLTSQDFTHSRRGPAECEERFNPPPWRSHGMRVRHLPQIIVFFRPLSYLSPAALRIPQDRLKHTIPPNADRSFLGGRRAKWKKTMSGRKIWLTLFLQSSKDFWSHWLKWILKKMQIFLDLHRACIAVSKTCKK